MLKVNDVVMMVRALGMTCNYRAEYGEFRINYKGSDYRWNGDDSAYYSTDKEDAIATAQAMSEWGK